MGPSLIDTEVELKRRMPSGAMHYGVAVDGSEMSKRAMTAGLYLNNTKVRLVQQGVAIKLHRLLGKIVSKVMQRNIMQLLLNLKTSKGLDSFLC